MKTAKVLKFALVIAAMFAFAACEEEEIKTKGTDGESQMEMPMADD